MPNLSDHHMTTTQKLMLIGDSGTGKTGSLVSLIKAGYRLRILDLDNGLDSLVAFARHECPDKLSNVDYETRRDRYHATQQGPIIKGAPKAFVSSLKLLDKWTDESNPAEWGPDTIFVLDSLTALGKAAYEWAKAMNPSAKDRRNWYFTAQSAVEDVIATLTGEDFKTNVIIISHVNLVEFEDGTKKGFPSAIGTALSKQIGKYFNTILLAETSGSGKNVKRSIRTVPTLTVDCKNPAPFSLEASLELPTAMATVFEKLREASHVKK